MRLPAYQVNVAQDRREKSAKHVAIASRQHDGRRGGHRQPNGGNKYTAGGYASNKWKCGATTLGRRPVGHVWWGLDEGEATGTRGTVVRKCGCPVIKRWLNCRPF